MFLLYSCVAQKNNLEKINVSYFYSNQTKLDSLKNEVTLYFETGFKDSLQIYYCDETILVDLFETDFSTSYTGKSVTISFQEPECRHITIELLNNSSKVNIEIKRGYRVIELSKSSSNWGAVYSNHSPVFE